MATRLLIAKTGSAAAVSNTSSSPLVKSSAAQLLLLSRTTRIGQITRAFSQTVTPAAASAATATTTRRNADQIMSKRTHSTAASGKMLTLENMNPNIVKMEYAVRGPLVIRATEIERELKAVSLIQNLKKNIFIYIETRQIM